MEDFVNFKISQKLKEKGFKNNCIGYYDYTGEFHYNYESAISNKEIYFCHNKYDNIWHRDLVDAPTISQVLKWLREEKKLHIELWSVGKKPIKWCHTITTLNHVGEKQGWSSGERGDSYEAAAIAGIEYCLDNLI